MKNRVVITGLGIVSPNGITLKEFQNSLEKGKSGIRHYEDLEELKFSCQLGASPDISKEKKREYLTELQLRNFKNNGIMYAVISGIDAIRDAGISEDNEEPLWDLGIIFGAGACGPEKFREAIYHVDNKNVRRLGSTTVLQTMTSGPSVYLGGILGAGNMVTANSSACATGTEALLMGYERIADGKAEMMLCGSTGDPGPYIWGGFDALRVTNYKFNENPDQVPGPMSANSGGFVPGAGAGAYVLENMDHAIKRGAKIYAEVLGGAINNGGQRGDGSMTAPNSIAIQRCITDALSDSGVDASEIDYINGHLTGTIKDPDEIKNWAKALNRYGKDFPYINSLKGMVGHCLAASGALELVSSVIQMENNFVFPNINLDQIHPEILEVVDPEKIPTERKNAEINTLAKASFGFGDVNACVILRKPKI